MVIIRILCIRVLSHFRVLFKSTCSFVIKNLRFANQHFNHLMILKVSCAWLIYASPVKFQCLVCFFFFHSLITHPHISRNLREMFKLDAAEYMMSICGDCGLRDLSSAGKSGSIFFLSQDDKFVIKTLTKYELKVCSDF